MRALDDSNGSLQKNSNNNHNNKRSCIQIRTHVIRQLRDIWESCRTDGRLLICLVFVRSTKCVRLGRHYLWEGGVWDEGTFWWENICAAVRWRLQIINMQHKGINTCCARPSRLRLRCAEVGFKVWIFFLFFSFSFPFLPIVAHYGEKRATRRSVSQNLYCKLLFNVPPPPVSELLECCFLGENIHIHPSFCFWQYSIIV